MATYDPGTIDLNSRDRVGRKLVTRALDLKPGHTVHFGPTYDAPVVIVRSNDLTFKRLTLADGRTFTYDDDMTFLVFWPAVDVWDADVYGNGENSGTRWALYVDDDEEGAIAAEAEARGQVHAGSSYFGEEDDWLYEEDAREFLATAVLDKED